MNDKYMDTDSEKINDQNLMEQALAEQDYLYMHVENIERQIAEGISSVKITSNLINKIKADTIRDAAECNWVMYKGKPAIMKSELIRLAQWYEELINIKD